MPTGGSFSMPTGGRYECRGGVANLAGFHGWVKGSFFKQRRFHDRGDLVKQLGEWLHETNHQRPNRATGEIPEQRRQQELERLRPMRTPPERLALRIPIQVDVTGEVSHDGLRYSMPPQAAGMAGTLYLYLYRDVVHIVAGRYEAEHPRHVPNGTVSRLAEHRTAHLAAISGARGRRYLKRQQLLETGAAALSFLTELIHLSPRSWYRQLGLPRFRGQLIAEDSVLAEECSTRGSRAGQALYRRR